MNGNEKIGTTIIDALTLCYCAEGKVLNMLKRTDNNVFIDTFLLKRTKGQAHNHHFDIHLRKKKVASLYFDRYGASNADNYIWLRVENEVLYNEMSLIETLSISGLLDLTFNNITHLDLARDYKYNVCDKIRQLMRSPQLKTILNGKQIKNRDEALDGVLRNCKMSLNRDLPKSLTIKQAKAKKNKYDGMVLDCYNKMDEITSKSHKQYILDYYGNPNKLHRLEVRLNNQDLKKISASLLTTISEESVFNQDTLDVIYLKALHSLLRFTAGRKKLDWQMLFDCNLRYR
jgi:hypothetical protein